MTSTVFHAFTRSLGAVAAAALLGACGYDAPQSPTASVASADIEAARPVDLSGCDDLRAPAQSELVLRSPATGVQTYRWTGASWQFVAPTATLYADDARTIVIGDHFGGPTWRSLDGSTVVGTVAARCTPDASAIPTLLLTAVSGATPGALAKITYIQRLSTVGGLAPSAPGSVVGELAAVPYTAVYFFYRDR